MLRFAVMIARARLSFFSRTMHEVPELTHSTSCDRGANSTCSHIEEPSALQFMSHYRMTACGCSYPGVWFS